MHNDKKIVFVLALVIAGLMVAMAIPAVRSAERLGKWAQIAELISLEPYAELVGFNKVADLVEIEIFGPMVNGTDGGCEYFVDFAWSIMQIHHRIRIYFHGEWIPGLKNPVDYNHIKSLKKGGRY